MLNNPTQDLQRTLLTINLALEALESVMPELFNCYHLAVENKLITPTNTYARIQLLELILPQIRAEFDHLHNLLNSAPK